MPTETQAIVNEIKLIIQEELSDVRESMHRIDLKMTALQGAAVARDEFQKALAEERDKREKAEKDHAEKIRDLENQVTSLQTSTKIYIGLATAISGLVSSTLVALFLSFM